MAAKFFTGLPLDGPDPECVGGDAMHTVRITPPKPSQDHTKPVTFLTRKCGGRLVLVGGRRRQRPLVADPGAPPAGRRAARCARGLVGGTSGPTGNLPARTGRTTPHVRPGR